ncbi:hypothetical protein KUCAC02_034708, partial [Chaenocephalus aceratus]
QLSLPSSRHQTLSVTVSEKSQSCRFFKSLANPTSLKHLSHHGQRPRSQTPAGDSVSNSRQQRHSAVEMGNS